MANAPVLCRIELEEQEERQQHETTTAAAGGSNSQPRQRQPQREQQQQQRKVSSPAAQVVAAAPSAPVKPVDSQALVLQMMQVGSQGLAGLTRVSHWWQTRGYQLRHTTSMLSLDLLTVLTDVALGSIQATLWSQHGSGGEILNRTGAEALHNGGRVDQAACWLLV